MRRVVFQANLVLPAHRAHLSGNHRRLENLFYHEGGSADPFTPSTFVDNSPAAPVGLSLERDNFAPIEKARYWKTLEHFTSDRWSQRPAIWRVVGPTDWNPDLVPASNFTAWRKTGDTWEAHALTGSPPYTFAEGIFAVEADVGAGPVPAYGETAFRQLVEFWLAREVKHRDAFNLRGDVANAALVFRGGQEYQAAFTHSDDLLLQAAMRSGAAETMRAGE